MERKQSPRIRSHDNHARPIRAAADPPGRLHRLEARRGKTRGMFQKEDALRSASRFFESLTNPRQLKKSVYWRKSHVHVLLSM